VKAVQEQQALIDPMMEEIDLLKARLREVEGR